jgi:hypothetical protein
MDAALTAQMPGLASLYETFTLLHGDGRRWADPPVGAEPPPVPLWRRRRFTGAAALALLAVVVALCAALSVELRPSAPSCQTAVSRVAAQARALDCGGYPASR